MCRLRGRSSCCRARAVGHVGSVVAVHGLSCSTGLVAPPHVGSSRTRDRSDVPCITRRILNHWTTREAPRLHFVKSFPLSTLEIFPHFRSCGGGNGNPLQYSSLENPMDRGAWWATGHGVTHSQTQLKGLNMCVSFSGNKSSFKKQFQFMPDHGR